jgi:hypothetical protein
MYVLENKLQCKLHSDIGCNNENYYELSNDKFIHMFSGTQIQGLLGIQGNSFCFYLNSLSMFSKNVDSNNSFVKLWIR